MKKHLLLTAIILALVMCLSFGVSADETGYVNNYDITGIQTTTDGNVKIMTVGAWRADNNVTDKTVTFFGGGEALSDDDIIITNGKAAIVLAVGTRNPWGYPAGSVLDAGVVKDGEGVRDTTWSIEFLPDWWDSWAPNNCGTVKFEIVNYDFDEDGTNEKAVKVTRMYDLAGSYGAEGQNNDKKMEVVTYYGAPQTGSYLYMFDSLANKGNDAIWYNGYEGSTGYQGTADGYENIAFSVTNKGDDGAATFGKGFANAAVGSYANTEGKESYEYQGQYLTSFVIPETTFISNKGNTFEISGNGGKSGYQELYVTNVSNDEVEASGNRKMFDVGESVQFKEYIVCSDSADHAVLNDFIFEQQGETTYPVSVAGIEGVTGTAEIIVYNNAGKLVGWYTIDMEEGGTIELPAGEYTYKVEKAGYCTSDATAFEVISDDIAEITPALGTEKVTVNVKVIDQDDNALFAKIGVYNANGVAYANTLYPTVRYCGNSVYQTEGSRGNSVKVEIPKDTDCWLKVFGEGFFFTSDPVEYKINAADATEGNTFEVEVEEIYTIDENWLGGDFHHHSNKNDAFALPADVMNSYMAYGLDVVSVTDHDYTVNNYESYQYLLNKVNASSISAVGFVPSIEISCSWAHFNVVPQTPESFDWFIDKQSTNAPAKDENGIGLAFTNLQYFVDEINDKGASVTANHPWYSYGLFTALGKDAIPGGYTDDYGMIGLNGSYRDQEMSKTIASGTDLWDGYLNYYESNNGKTKIGGKEIDVESTHYFAGGSDTHDVFTPYMTNTAETSDVLRENREEFFSGKVRSYAYVEEVATEGEFMKENGLAFDKAMVNGNSYTTTGPILGLSDVPGNDVETGEININRVADTYYLNVDIGSLAGIRDIIVMTDEADGTYTAYTGKANQNSLGYRFKRQFALTHVDEELSIANGLDGAETDPALCAINDSTERVYDFNYTVEYQPSDNGLHWMAVCVVDVNGNFAVTNAYWVQKYTDINSWAWYSEAVDIASCMGILSGYEDNSFRPNANMTRAEFAQVIYKTLTLLDYEGKATKNLTFSDVKEGSWYYEAVTYLTERDILHGYPDGTFQPNAAISRAEICQIIYSLLPEDIVHYRHKVFTDVESDQWYFEAINTLAEVGIANGYDDGSFRPQRLSSRAEAVQFLFGNDEIGILGK